LREHRSIGVSAFGFVPWVLATRVLKRGSVQPGCGNPCSPVEHRFVCGPIDRASSGAGQHRSRSIGQAMPLWQGRAGYGRVASLYPKPTVQQGALPGRIRVERLEPGRERRPGVTGRPAVPVHSESVQASAPTPSPVAVRAGRARRRARGGRRDEMEMKGAAGGLGGASFSSSHQVRFTDLKPTLV
jgi:hypothetical protein